MAPSSQSNKQHKVGAPDAGLSNQPRLVRPRVRRRDAPARNQEVPMPKYLLSVHSVEGERREPMSEDDMKSMMARVGAVEEEMTSAGALVFGGRLQQADAATVVRVSDGETLTTDGPFAETKEHLGGFYIIDAEGHDVALSWAAKTAACVSTPIEVRAFWDQGGS
jgi:hypothetical protein